MAAKRKVAKKASAKKAGPRKRSPKPATRSKAGAKGQNEVHYSDLRKVMLASVLKRLK
jgi:hypothetical protein